MKLDGLLASIRSEFGIVENEIVVYRSHECLCQHSSLGFFPHHFIYSASKLTTMTAMMQACEMGLIGLDDPVSRYLEEYDDVLVLEAGHLRPPKNPMTIRHLASMQARLSYDVRSKSLLDCIKAGHTDTRSIIRALAREPLHFDPGMGYEYSLAHDVIACIIEVASGIPFDQFCQSRIFDRLSMNSTGFKTYDDMAQQYQMVDGMIERLEGNEFIFGPDYISGGAGVVTTSLDYIKLADALSCKDPQILKASSIDAMRTNQLSPETRRIYQSKHTEARKDYSYALGVRTHVARTNSLSSIGEFGWDGAAGAYVLCDPELELSIYYSEDLRFCPSNGSVIHPMIRDAVYRSL